ncbi:TPA: hypothetical protein DEB72_01185 [Patescibacteria group bacterium]|nr:hypothetical protein [Patescibacteria group bacterium]
MHAKKNNDYYRILKHASLLIPDGAGITSLSYLFNEPLTKGRVMGVNLAERVLKESAFYDLKVFIIGDNLDVLKNVANKYGGKISYAAGPMFNNWENFPLADQTNDFLIERIEAESPDILLVGFGAPKQERWIDYYLPKLSTVKIAMGVGGSLDYLGERLKRAPLWMQTSGIEWLWRVILQPKRIFRIIRAVFIFPILATFSHFRHEN